MLKIVALDAFPLDAGDIGWDAIRAFGDLELRESSKPGDLATCAADADIILVNKFPIGASEIASLKKCRLVGVLATGANVLDIAALTGAGIAVANVPGYGVEDVAQHALALLLELARHTALHSESVKAGDWRKKGWCYWLKPPLCLTGLTLGIAGFGAIGRMLGRYGNALGMKILAWSRSRNASETYPFEYVDLAALLERSDVVSLHCPLSPGTEKMINSDSIAAMKDGAFLINTARGGLVDEDAVAAALYSGKLAGYGADVLCHEPPDDSNPLLHAPNTLLTPHNAWATRRARQKIVDIMAENIGAFLEGRALNRLNRTETARPQKN